MRRWQKNMVCMLAALAVMCCLACIPSYGDDQSLGFNTEFGLVKPPIAFPVPHSIKGPGPYVTMRATPGNSMLPSIHDPWPAKFGQAPSNTLRDTGEHTIFTQPRSRSYVPLSEYATQNEFNSLNPFYRPYPIGAMSRWPQQPSYGQRVYTPFGYTPFSQ